MKKFREKNRRIPKIRDKGMSGIKRAIYRSEWQHLGISNWNDLLLYAFGKVNDPKFKYKGRGVLENIVKTLIDFARENNKIPRTTDKEMKGIKKA